MSNRPNEPLAIAEQRDRIANEIIRMFDIVGDAVKNNSESLKMLGTIAESEAARLRRLEVEVRWIRLVLIVQGVSTAAALFLWSS